MAINFASTSDKVQAQVNASLAINAFTAAGWFRCSSITTDGNFNTVFNLLNGTSTGTVYFGSNSAGTGFRYRLGISGLVVEPSTATEPFEANKWFFFAIRGNGTEAAVFLAKEPNFTINKYTTTGSFTNATGLRAQLGANSPEGGAFAMRGAYSDFKVWAAALSDAEIQSVSKRVAPSTTTSFSNWFPLNRSVLADCYVDYGPTANNLIATSGTPTITDGPPVSWGASILAPSNDPSISYTIYRPTSNVTAQWTVTGATTNYEAVDDEVFSDINASLTDNVLANVSSLVDEYKFTIPEGVTLKANSNLMINYTTRLLGEANLYINLYQSTSLIKSEFITTKLNSGGRVVLTREETANITDLQNISVRITSA